MVDSEDKNGVCQRDTFMSFGTLCPIMDLKPEFWTPGPNSGDPVCQVQPPAPKPQIKGLVKAAEKGGFRHSSGHAWEEAEEALSPSSAIFGLQS
jgi:hypothetical protein